MDLYMTELVVGRWPAAVAWYRDVMGLPMLLYDESRKFALLGGDGGRLALKAGQDVTTAGTVRLTFLVGDLAAMRSRLIHADASASAIVEDVREGFRSFQVIDPEGRPITLFAWSDQTATKGRT